MTRAQMQALLLFSIGYWALEDVALPDTPLREALLDVKARLGTACFHQPTSDKKKNFLITPPALRASARTFWQFDVNSARVLAGTAYGGPTILARMFDELADVLLDDCKKTGTWVS